MHAHGRDSEITRSGERPPCCTASSRHDLVTLQTDASQSLHLYTVHQACVHDTGTARARGKAAPRASERAESKTKAEHRRQTPRHSQRRPRAGPSTDTGVLPVIVASVPQCLVRGRASGRWRRRHRRCCGTALPPCSRAVPRAVRRRVRRFATEAAAEAPEENLGPFVRNDDEVGSATCGPAHGSESN
ncbi:unnamed protein product [Lampetra planeri]